MKPSREYILAFVVGAIVALALGGCQTAGVTVPRVPGWERPSADSRTFTAGDVALECSRLAPYAAVELSDATFVPVSHAWMERAADWSWHFGRATGIAYTPESFDCDKFAAAFALAANVAAARAGVRAQPLVARIHVAQVDGFGGVAAGGGHALVAFLSDRGLHVFEPQTRALVPLAAYPNLKHIFRVKIGG